MSLVICAVGDVMIGRSFNTVLKGHFNVWGDTKHVFDTSHLVFGNLKTCIGDDGREEDKNEGGEIGEIPLHSNLKSEYSGILREIPFDYLAIANNHILDYYQTIGLRETLLNLGSLDIMTSGAGLDRFKSRKPAIFKIKIIGTTETQKKELVNAIRRIRRIAIFSGSGCKSWQSSETDAGIYYINRDSPENAMDYIQYYKSTHPNTFIILNYYWGHGRDGRQDQNLAESKHYFAVKMFDSGVDLILGHSMDDEQGFEKINNKYVFYSLGNFINDSSVPTSGVIARININLKSGIVESIDNYETYISDLQVNIKTKN
jgi:poly-gamma-glutamate capsule biosynthesis protein CapA/YwtB (metallophosphatase superfamily)